MDKEIKFFIIDQLGMIIGEYYEENGKTYLKNPLLIQVGERAGTFGLSSNPFFEESMEVNESYVVIKSKPKSAILEQYESYLTKKRTGLVTAKGDLIK